MDDMRAYCTALMNASLRATGSIPSCVDDDSSLLDFANSDGMQSGCISHIINARLMGLDNDGGGGGSMMNQ